MKTMQTKDKHPVMDMICADFHNNKKMRVSLVAVSTVITEFTPLNKAGLHHTYERVRRAPLTGVPEVN